MAADEGPVDGGPEVLGEAGAVVSVVDVVGVFPDVEGEKRGFAVL